MVVFASWFLLFPSYTKEQAIGAASREEVESQITNEEILAIPYKQKNKNHFQEILFICGVVNEYLC